MFLVIRYAKRSTWAVVKKNSGLREQVGARNEPLDSHVIEKTTSQVYLMGLPHGHPHADIELQTIKETTMASNHKPGEDNRRPGTYVEVGPRGGAVANPRIVHIDQGDRLPPTQESGHLWQHRPAAKH